METDALNRLDDWQALCDWLEDRAYNASYNPNCRGAYLLSGYYPARRTIPVDDPNNPPYIIAGRAVPRKTDIPNPEYQAERKRAQFYTLIVKERSRLQLVYWATGYGWRLRKDYQAKIDAERERLSKEGP
jgi:hypothetical protein